jgi:hypothetical protein
VYVLAGLGASTGLGASALTGLLFFLSISSFERISFLIWSSLVNFLIGCLSFALYSSATSWAISS